MTIAAAQTIPKDGDVIANLADHCRLAEIAAEKGVQLLVFPEMSVTGYQRKRARALSFIPNDPRLKVLRLISAERKMIIIVGAPILISEVLYIGTFILYPDDTEAIYTKQFLHEGEEMYFTNSFTFNPQVKIGSDNVSLAICADISHPVHAGNAAAAGATTYAAGIFYTPRGLAEGYMSLAGYAKRHSMLVVMSNYGGRSCGMDAAGCSAAWNEKGQLIAALDESGEGLLIVADGDNEREFEILMHKNTWDGD